MALLDYSADETADPKPRPARRKRLQSHRPGTLALEEKDSFLFPVVSHHSVSGNRSKAEQKAVGRRSNIPALAPYSLNGREAVCLGVTGR